ncbi:MAG TPA: carboxypeptidase regulatory-like domain-containing protein, partial [Thermoanaerobaculia bacterium]|nr:carboxypeptidase regulatory-like domain-containing protein [Thermoanaerobaculia bacterium]
MLATLLLLATVAINAPQPIPITGQVLDAGRPHAGARVDLYTVHGDNPLGSALTRPDGSYELTAPESGAYRVVVQAKDRLSLEHLVVPLVEEAALPPVELLSPDGWRPAESPQRPEGNVTRVVTGKVVDAQTGKPVAGALVWGGLPPDLPPVRTGEDGAFRLPLPKSRRSFGVAAAGYLLSEAGPGQPEKPVTVALKKAARVQGQVVDSEGAPVAGVFLQIRPVPFQDQRLSSLRYLSELLSRADGSFSIPGLLPGGVYKLSASKPGHGKMEVEIRTAPAGRPTPSARVILGTGVTMIGRIVDETGKPVEGASVDLLQDDPTGFLQAVSDASGVFSIRGLAPGQYQLAAVRKGFSPITHSGVLMPEGPARLDLGDITLKAGAAIEGKVIDAEGRTVEGAEVQASKTQEEMNFLSLGNQQADVVTFSSKDGHFQIRDLEPGLRYSVSVRHPDYPPESLSGVEAPTAEPVTIELQPSRTLSGRVVGPDGEPVPDAEIMLVTQTGFGSYVGGMLGRTDSAGDFRGSGLRPGAIDLQISAPGYQKTAWRGIQIPRDRDPEPVIINLERGGILEVRAVDQEGNPMAEVRFHISPKARPVGGMFMGGLFEPVSGADGTFRVTGLPPGEYNVFAHASQLGRSVERTVRAGSGVTRVDLLFERGVEVSGRVVNDDGQPIPSASVQLATSSDQGSQAVGGSSQADGSFLIPSVLDGEHQLTASAKGYGKSEPRRLAVSGSRVEGIEIRLSREAGGTIVGRILGLPAEELSRFRIAADLDGNNLETAEALPDEQGR